MEPVNQVQEAVELHGYPAERTIATGAPRFDPLFERAPSETRASLQHELGLDPARATVVWLGSSKFVAPREPQLVEEWQAALRASGAPRLRDANVLVRPHPQAVETPLWTEWRPPAGIVVPPRVVRDRAQDLADQLFVSDAVVALNTSASIEAAILDRPVLTIRGGEEAPGQEGQLNVAYLLEENGGFVQTAETMAEHVDQLAAALDDDPLAERRAAFIDSFARPAGRDRPAGEVLADGIEELGRAAAGSPTAAPSAAAR
jgi:CDP-glycerol glycerophosphotransferase (TagB/SpsB family)